MNVDLLPDRLLVNGSDKPSTSSSRVDFQQLMLDRLAILAELGGETESLATKNVNTTISTTDQVVAEANDLALTAAWPKNIVIDSIDKLAVDKPINNKNAERNFFEPDESLAEDSLDLSQYSCYPFAGMQPLTPPDFIGQKDILNQELSSDKVFDLEELSAKDYETDADNAALLGAEQAMLATFKPQNPTQFGLSTDGSSAVNINSIVIGETENFSAIGVDKFESNGLFGNGFSALLDIKPDEISDRVMNDNTSLANEIKLSKYIFQQENSTADDPAISSPLQLQDNDKNSAAISNILTMETSSLIDRIEDNPSHQHIFEHLTDFINNNVSAFDASTTRNKTSFAELPTVYGQNLSSTMDQDKKATLLDIQRNLSENNSNYSINGYSAKIKIHPAELGQINAEIMINKGQAELRLVIENNQVKHAIETHLQQLRDSFQESSVNLTQVNIQTSQGQEHRSFKDDFKRQQPVFDKYGSSKQIDSTPDKERQSSQSLIDAYA